MGYSAFPKALVLLEPPHQIVLCHDQDTCWGSFTPLQRCSWCILQPQLKLNFTSNFWLRNCHYNTLKYKVCTKYQNWTCIYPNKKLILNERFIFFITVPFNTLNPVSFSLNKSSLKPSFIWYEALYFFLCLQFRIQEKVWLR